MNQAYLDIRLQTARGEAAGILGPKLRQLEREGLVVVYREDLEKLREALRWIRNYQRDYGESLVEALDRVKCHAGATLKELGIE